MQRLTAAPRDHLTEQEVMSLLTGDQVTVDFGADLLNADLSFAEDISADLQSATVERRMLNRIHGTARLRLSRELAWGTALVRLWQSLSRRRGWKDVSETVDVGPLPYADVVAESGPVGYWRLGEASGTVAVDASGNGHDGTYEGAPTLGVAGALVADEDTAARFGGGANYVTVSPFLPDVTALTMEVWFYRDALQTGPLLEFRNGVHLWNFQNPSDLFVNFLGTDGTQFSLTAANAIEAGQWYHAVATYDGTTGRLYLNGAEVASGASTRTLVTSSALDFARRGTTYSDVREDEPAVYDRALTADEVKRHYEAGRARIRDYATVTRTVPDVLTARFNVGVYQPVTPEHPRGETPVTYDVSAFDRLYLLDRQVGTDYTVLAGTTYRDALLQAFTDAGLTGVDIDGSAADDTLPKDKTWPLVAQDMSDPDQTSTPVTFLRVVNDLGRAINMRGVWTDANGRYRLQSYRDPKTAGSEMTLDADSNLTILGEDRTIIEDMWATPNKWVVISANPPDGVTPTEANGLVQVRENLDDGPTSQNQRGMVWPAVYSYEAATAAKLSALADRRMAQDLRVTRRIEVATGPLPVAGHFDVVTLKDAEAGLNVKAQATAWEQDLTGAQDCRWTFEVI